MSALYGISRSCYEVEWGGGGGGGQQMTTYKYKYHM